jgi:hypothetical protein
MRWCVGAGAVLLGLGLSTCSNPTTGPTAGTISVSLAGAGATDRALLIEISGSDSSAAIDSVEAAPGTSYVVFSQRQVRARWRAILTGSLANGPVLRVVIADKTKSGLYGATVLDVADSAFAELPPGTRTLSVAP